MNGTPNLCNTETSQTNIQSRDSTSWSQRQFSFGIPLNVSKIFEFVLIFLAFLNEQFAKIGIQEFYFPLLMREQELKKEKEHLKGFVLY